LAPKNRSRITDDMREVDTARKDVGDGGHF
jgi:hypothetical protein